MPIHPRTSPETAAKIRALYLAGEKVDVIALDCGVTKALVAKLTSDLPRREPKEEAKRLRVLELAGTGLDIGAIAAEVGCPVATVRRALRPRPLTREEEEARLDALDAARTERRKAKASA